MTIMLWSSVSVYEYEVESMAMMPCCQQKSNKVASCCSQKDTEEKEKPCDGNCNNNSCKCITHVLASAFVFEELTLVTEPVEYSDSKEFTLHNEGSISFEYTFIWAPPKIG
jgi:hypothetical protein